jgi:hypothetical protein
MFSFSWPVQPETLVHALAPQLVTFPWTLRLAQAAAALAAGLVVAWLCRSTPHRVWLVPLSAVALRLLCDPCLFGYYWIAPSTLVLCGIAIALRDRAWATLAATAVAFLWLALRAGGREGALTLVAVVAAAAVATRLRRRPSLTSGGGELVLRAPVATSA